MRPSVHIRVGCRQRDFDRSENSECFFTIRLTIRNANGSGAPLLAIHALLHDCPLNVVGHEETVEAEIEAILYRGAVDLGDQMACAGELSTVETDTFAERLQLSRCRPRVLASTAADMDA